MLRSLGKGLSAAGAVPGGVAGHQRLLESHRVQPSPSDRELGHSPNGWRRCSPPSMAHPEARGRTWTVKVENASGDPLECPDERHPHSRLDRRADRQNHHPGDQAGAPPVGGPPERGAGAGPAAGGAHRHRPDHRSGTLE